MSIDSYYDVLGVWQASVQLGLREQDEHLRRTPRNQRTDRRLTDNNDSAKRPIDAETNHDQTVRI